MTCVRFLDGKTNGRLERQVCSLERQSQTQASECVSEISFPVFIDCLTKSVIRRDEEMERWRDGEMEVARLHIKQKGKHAM